jgi:hypothetical protein
VNLDQGDLYLDLPFDDGASVSAANYPLRIDPSRDCAAAPVSTLDDLPRDGGFVSIQEAQSGSSYANARPASATLLPIASPEAGNSILRCLHRPADFLFRQTGFTDNGHMLHGWLALGVEANDAVRRQLVEVLDSLATT